MQGFKMEIRLSNRFKKHSRKTNDKIRKSLTQRLKLFEQNPNHPLLRNHALTGKFKNFRVLILQVIGELYIASTRKRKIIVVFELLGTHSQLYR